MGLSATVHCDCFERGLLRTPPPAGARPSVEADGSLVCNSDEFAVQLAFDAWLHNAACAHEDGRLRHEDLGNLSRVATVRQRLAREPQRYPLLLSRVVYDGSHTGDWIAREHLPDLAAELASLPIDDDDGDLADFQRSMQALCAAALRTDKPIVF